MIEVIWDDRAIRSALQNLQQSVGNVRPALFEIGEYLLRSTKNRFSTKIAPDGTPWSDNSPVTIEIKGRNWPLTGDSGDLGRQFDYELIGNDGLDFYSTMRYAAMQQFGGTKSQFSQLWGDIPARPFIGISEADEQEILDIISSHLSV